MTSTVDATAPRARILRAASDLLASGGRGAVSVRAVSAAADVQPQTIYRQFGDMSGLLAEAAHEGFRSYLAVKSSRTRRRDPVDDLRDGWDLHIEFGLQNPALYLLMYGEPDSRKDLPVAAETAAILRGLVEAVARAGRLRTDVDLAAAMIHATGIGVTIQLIGRHAASGVSTLSTRVREAVLQAITIDDPAEPADPADQTAPSHDDALARHAAALRALMSTGSSQLTPGEALLLDEMLARISSTGSL